MARKVGKPLVSRTLSRPPDAGEITKRLLQRYPNARTALHFSNPLELLVATILSAQCTDARVNMVTETLFRKYRRAADYARFLGKGRVELYACAIDTGRVSGGAARAFRETAFEARYFLVVARFVPKKNHLALLDLYEAYLARAARPRRLKLVGYGVLEGEIAARIAGSELLARFVSVEGYRPAREMPEVMGRALALLLPSVEEQFGIVVTEALASGIPVVLSPACGAAVLVEDFVNGFVLEPGNTEGWVAALERMGSEAEWRRMSGRCLAAARGADTAVFVGAMERLQRAVRPRRKA